MTDEQFAAIMGRLDELASRMARLEMERGDKDSLLDIRDVMMLTTLSERELYRRMKAGTFPHSQSVGDSRRRVWPRAVVTKWVKRQLKVERAEPG